MKPTINLINALVTQGRHYYRLGLLDQALARYRKLGQMQALPERVAVEAQVRLTQIHTKQRRFLKARRHLTAVMAVRGATSHDHYRLGALSAADISCEPRKALAHYRRCLQLAPRNTRYRSAYGLLLVLVGKVEKGFRLLESAVRAAPDDLRVLRRYCRALKRVKRLDEARDALRCALFRNPRDSRYRALWDRFQFHILQQQQQRADRQQPVVEPCLLPFAPRLSVHAPQGDGELRLDAPSGIPAPRILCLHRRPQRKQR